MQIQVDVDLADVDTADLKNELKERGGWTLGDALDLLRAQSVPLPPELLRGLEIYVSGSLTEIREWCAARRER